MTTTATIENMRQHYQQGVFAYSPDTGEEYSADPADYWNAPDGFTMKDGSGEPMILVYRAETYLDAASKPPTDDGWAIFNGGELVFSVDNDKWETIGPAIERIMGGGTTVHAQVSPTGCACGLVFADGILLSQHISAKMAPS